MSLVLAHDRTAEFRSAVKAKLHGMHQRPEAAPRTTAPSERSMFLKRASGVAQEIAVTTRMLQQLAQLAKRRAMYDDNPHEIAELTLVIKQKVGGLKDSIGRLDEQTKQLGGTRRDEQADTMSKNVVMTLQGKLKEITGDFTSVLEERSQNMQASRSRTGQFVAPQPAMVTNNNPLYQERNHLLNQESSRYQENPYAGVSDNNVEEDGELLLPSQEQSVVLLEDQQTGYLSQRSSAVDAIESTINELGQMFSQLSTMIAEQRDTVQRIDANTEDISMNVSGAHRELLKYYARVASNRGLMLKSFGIIIGMFFLWVLIS